MQATEGLARKNAQAPPDQRPDRRIEQPVGRRHTDHPVAQVAPRRVDRPHLWIVARRVADRVIPRLDLRLQLDWIELCFLRQGVHSPHEIGQAAVDQKEAPPLLEGFPPSGSRPATTKSAPRCLKASTGPGPDRETARRSSKGMLLRVRSGFCSDPDSGNSRLMIFCVKMNHE